ncbi:MAG: YfgM family protein [Pseudomonadales bacterium]
MTELRTEEEQIAAIKDWWKENGKSIIIAVVVALGAVYGWKAWQQKQLDDSEAASMMYQQLLDAAVPAATTGGAEDLATTKHLSAQLKSEFGGTEYAQLGALMSAKVAFSAADYSAVSSELDWVIASDANKLIKAIAGIRKAQLALEQSEFDSAIKQLQDIAEPSLVAQVQELLGDVYIAKGDRTAARAAYEKAFAAGQSTEGSVLSMKLGDLAVEEG